MLAVHRATRHSEYANKEGERAVKVLGPVSTSTAGELLSIQRECSILAAIQGSPCVARFHGLCCVALAGGAQPCWALVTERARGADLFEAAVGRALGERQVAEVVKGLLSGIAHIHALGIAHRDVKAEGVILKTGAPGGALRPVLTDFGSASHLSDAAEMQRRVGSPGYIAPEVLLGMPYGLNVDVFGAGVILYFLLCGRRPFTGRDTGTIIQKNVKCRVRFSHRGFEECDPSATAFCAQLLTMNAEERPSANSALSSPWLFDEAGGAKRPEEAEGAEEEALGALPPLPPSLSNL